MESIILEWPIEPGTVVWGHGKIFLQPAHQIWVTGEVPTIQETVVFTGFNNSPGIFVIPTASGEERSGSKDLAEAIEGHIQQAPALKELVLFFEVKDLFEALN
jgi:hypothetical protein